jgi:hypothetical protein
MKREEILAMVPGEKLNKLVAVKLMGYQLDKHRNGWVKLGDFSTYPKQYSKDISAAWEVIRKLREDNWWIVLNSEGEKWSALFYWDPHQQAYECEADEAPEAICKAALLVAYDFPEEETKPAVLEEEEA